MQRRQFLSLAPAAISVGAVGISITPARAQQTGGTMFTAVQRYSLGDWTIVALGDGFLPFDPALLQNISTDDARAMFAAGYADPQNMYVNTNAYLVDTGSDLILIDTGTGPNFGPTLGNMAANIEAAGYAPSQISKVLATHLHPDHVGGCVINGANPFAGAEFMVSRADHGFFTSDEMRALAPEGFRGFFDLAKAAVGGFGEKVTLFEGEATVAPGITSIPLPGHTPGHVGFMLESGGESLLIWGDIVHVPAVQFARPEVTLAFDTDPVVAAKTRDSVVDRVVADRQLIAGMHLLFPGFGYVEKAAEGYRFVPAPWEFS